MEPLDVLVFEANPGDAAAGVAELTAAGHEVHQCFESSGQGIACKAVTDDHCPLDEGIDVAVLFRRRVTPRPTARERGAHCAVRAGVPLLEDGPTVLDHYEPYLAGRVTTSVVEACVEAVRRFDADLRTVTETTLAAMLDGIEVAITFERRGQDLEVEIGGPDLPMQQRHALGVRVLDALRKAKRDARQIGVRYRVVEPSSPAQPT